MTPQLAIVEDLSLTPGAMECKLRREVPGGVIAYYEAEAGWLTQAGTPRLRPYRRYLWTPNDGEQPIPSIKLASVSSIEEEVCPKRGLPPWSEARGIEGLLLAVQTGAIDPATVDAEQAIKLVRGLKLGAEAAAQLAAERGVSLHAIDEHYMRTEEGPRFADHPREHHGYIRAWAKCTLALKPKPVETNGHLEVEQLVVNPEMGYAGRLDRRVIIGGRLETNDLKTNENSAIWPGAHLKVCLYERGAIRSGAEPADRRRVIVFAADGTWDSMLADHEDWQIDAALAWWRAKRPIDSACSARNRAVRT